MAANLLTTQQGHSNMTLVFNTRAQAEQFAKEWSRKTLMGHTLGKGMTDVEVTVYDVTAELSDWIENYQQTQIELQRILHDLEALPEEETVSHVYFEISIDSANAQVVDHPTERVIEVLEKAIKKLKAGSLDAPLQDENGNTIGSLSLDIVTE